MEQPDIPIDHVYGVHSELINNAETALEASMESDSNEEPLNKEESRWAYDPSPTCSDDIENVPKQFRQAGAQVEMASDTGETKTFFVPDIKDGKLTVDGNHPLVGKAITLHVTLKAIRDATTEEIQQGRQSDDLPEGMLH